MSSDGQDLSPALQRKAITEYAELHGMRIVATNEDPGRSGLTIQNRPSMRRLIKDVADDGCPFRVVLVYDISRWGRFFDVDESAYYEYHCRLHGVVVHYVQEVFTSELSLTSALLKSMKRVMAAEYSRELGHKCRAGQTKVVELGYQMGLLPCLGFRRLAIAADGTGKKILEFGERKPAPTDRVRWVFGPENEVELVRTIFRLYATTRLSMQKIADLLNSQGHVTIRGNCFSDTGLRVLLGCEAYVGNFVWGRRAHDRSARRRLNTDPALSRKVAVLPPMIDPETWELVQRKRQNPTACRLSDSEALQSLRDALRNNPDLREKDLLASGCLSGGTFRNRFGSFVAAAELAAAGRGRELVEVRQRMRATRELIERLIKDLVTLLEESGVGAVRLPRQCAILIRNQARIVVQLLWRKDIAGRARWQIKKRSVGDCQYVLLARMQDGTSAADFVLLTAGEYWRCQWSVDLIPACGIPCRTGEELLQSIRDRIS